MIISEAYYFKLAELAIFFNWIKKGKFGQVYGQLDPIFITSAFQDFIVIRRDEIARHNREEDRKKREEVQDEVDIVRDGFNQLKKAHGNKSAWEIYQSMKLKDNNKE